MTATDDELIGRVRNGDEAAFAALCERHRAALRRHLLGILRDGDAADDVLQEVLLRLWTHAHRWDARGALRSWLYRIATNQALNHLRSVRRRRQQPLDPPPDPRDDDDSRYPAWLIDSAALGPEALLERAERSDLLRRLVARLPEEKREVIRLIHDAELEAREVAAALGIPEGTVRSRLHYATRRLARDWAAEQAAEEDLDA